MKSATRHPPRDTNSRLETSRWFRAQCPRRGRVREEEGSEKSNGRIEGCVVSPDTDSKARFVFEVEPGKYTLLARKRLGESVKSASGKVGVAVNGKRTKAETKLPMYDRRASAIPRQFQTNRFGPRKPEVVHVLEIFF